MKCFEVLANLDIKDGLPLTSQGCVQVGRDFLKSQAPRFWLPAQDPSRKNLPRRINYVTAVKEAQAYTLKRDRSQAQALILQHAPRDAFDLFWADDPWCPRPHPGACQVCLQKRRICIHECQTCGYAMKNGKTTRVHVRPFSQVARQPTVYKSLKNPGAGLSGADDVLFVVEAGTTWVCMHYSSTYFRLESWFEYTREKQLTQTLQVTQEVDPELACIPEILL